LESKDNDYTVGRNLYFNLSLFCNPDDFISEECWSLIDEYNVVSEYNIPPARSVDETEWHKIQYFNIIKSEMNAIREYNGEKQKH